MKSKYISNRIGFENNMDSGLQSTNIVETAVSNGSELMPEI